MKYLVIHAFILIISIGKINNSRWKYIVFKPPTTPRRPWAKPRSTTLKIRTTTSKDVPNTTTEQTTTTPEPTTTQWSQTTFYYKIEMTTDYEDYISSDELAGQLGPGGKLQATSPKLSDDDEFYPDEPTTTENIWDFDSKQLSDKDFEEAINLNFETGDYKPMNFEFINAQFALAEKHNRPKQKSTEFCHDQYVKCLVTMKSVQMPLCASRDHTIYSFFYSFSDYCTMHLHNCMKDKHSFLPYVRNYCPVDIHFGKNVDWRRVLKPTTMAAEEYKFVTSGPESSNKI